MKFLHAICGDEEPGGMFEGPTFRRMEAKGKGNQGNGMNGRETE